MNEGGVGNIQTLSSTDSLDGGDGTDSLTVVYNTAVTPLSITNIENLTLSDANAGTEIINLVNVTGVTTLTSLAAAAAVDMDNLRSIPTLVLKNQGENVDIDFVDSVVSGSSDTINLVVESNTDGDVTIEGVETVNITSQGFVTNVLDINDTGTSLTSITVTGSANLTLNDTTALEAEVTNVNASALTGNLNLTATNAAVMTITGGSGDDTIVLGDTYASTDTVNGGAGTGDVLAVGEDELIAITTTALAANVTNIERIRVTEALGGGDNVNINHYVGVSEIEFDVGLAGSSTVTLSAGDTIDMEADVGANLTIEVDGSGNSDVVTLILDNADVGGNVVATTAETLNITSTGTADGGVNTITGTTAVNSLAGDQSIVITGAEALTFSGAVTADVINGSAMTDVLTITAGTASSAIVTGGSAADVLMMADGFSDIISGGAGNDAITFDIEASDQMTGGEGVDTFLMGDDTDTTFVVSIIQDLATTDALDLDLSTLEANTLGGAAITDLQDGNSGSVAAGNAVVTAITADNQAITTGSIILLSGKTYADSAAALTDIGGAGDRTFTFGATLGDNEGIVLAYELTGGGTELAVVSQNGGVNTSSTMDAIDPFLQLVGVSASTLSSFDIDFVA